MDKWYPLRDIDIGADTATARVDRAVASAVCEGHFPDEAIVPGAHALGWLAELGRRFAAVIVGTPVEFCAAPRSEFPRAIRPDDNIQIVVRRVASDDDVRVRLRGHIEIDGAIAARATLGYKRSS